MREAFVYCAELVRSADRDRFIASLFAPAEFRDALNALYAFNIEVSRVREAVREPLPGEIRLQWWVDVLRGERAGEAAANPVASALLATLERHRLPAARLIELADAHRFDLYNEAMADIAELEDYAGKTSSALFGLAAQIVAGVETGPVADPLGIAYAIAGLLRAFPRHAARQQIYVPAELLERHEVRLAEVFAGRSSAGLNAALAELRSQARLSLAVAGERLNELPGNALPAFLPAALIRPSLDLLERGDPFSPRELPAWRRQWLILRAARNPARIAR
jgi:phytoene synthase